MSGRCKDCRWWGDGEESPDELARECGNEVTRREATEEHQRTKNVTMLVRVVDGKVVPGDPNAIGHLFTGPESGCVHFEERGSDGN